MKSLKGGRRPHAGHESSVVTFFVGRAGLGEGAGVAVDAIEVVVERDLDEPCA